MDRAMFPLRPIIFRCLCRLFESCPPSTCRTEWRRHCERMRACAGLHCTHVRRELESLLGGPRIVENVSLMLDARIWPFLWECLNAPLLDWAMYLMKKCMGIAEPYDELGPKWKGELAGECVIRTAGSGLPSLNSRIPAASKNIQKPEQRQ